MIQNLDHMNVKQLNNREEIIKSFDVFVQLRPHLTSAKSFVDQIISQQREGYKIIALEEDGEIISCVGFRFLSCLAWGKILYVDDLITKEKNRGQGYGKILLDHIIQIAREHSCNAVHLDTGYGRHFAHKFYLKLGFEFNCHHLALKL